MLINPHQAYSEHQHLCYCSNIHPGETWPEHFAELRRHVPAIKARVAPDQAFGLGLRLSAIAATQLRQADTLNALKNWLNANDCYVYTLNGFPYGQFHGGPVKTAVYRPDWRDDARREYTLTLAEILTELLPDTQRYGSISSVPIGFAADFNSDADWQTALDQLRRTADALAELETRSGKRILLALEPEPACALETTDQLLQFFNEQLFNSPRSSDDCPERRHIGVCIDTCHQAVQFEDANEVFRRIVEANIPIAKVQLSAALACKAADAAALTPFADTVYLHQSVLRQGDKLTRYLDLPDALADVLAEPISDTDATLRTHFHVPVHRADFGKLQSTQPFLKQALRYLRAEPGICAHLEIETYTWAVLPKALQTELDMQLQREINWCLTEAADSA